MSASLPCYGSVSGVDRALIDVASPRLGQVPVVALEAHGVVEVQQALFSAVFRIGSLPPSGR